MNNELIFSKIKNKDQSLNKGTYAIYYKQEDEESKRRAHEVNYRKYESEDKSKKSFANQTIVNKPIIKR